MVFCIICICKSAKKTLYVFRNEAIVELVGEGDDPVISGCDIIPGGNGQVLCYTQSHSVSEDTTIRINIPGKGFAGGVRLSDNMQIYNYW